MDPIRLKTKELQSKMYLTQTQTYGLIGLRKAVNWGHVMNGGQPVFPLLIEV